MMGVVKRGKFDKIIDIEVYGQSGQTHVLIFNETKITPDLYNRKRT